MPRDKQHPGSHCGKYRIRVITPTSTDPSADPEEKRISIKHLSSSSVLAANNPNIKNTSVGTLHRFTPREEAPLSLDDKFVQDVLAAIARKAASTAVKVAKRKDNCSDIDN
jgi:hypothetical protein